MRIFRRAKNATPYFHAGICRGRIPELLVTIITGWITFGAGIFC